MTTVHATTEPKGGSPVVALPWQRKPQSAVIVARKDILLGTVERNGMKPANLAVILVETTTSKRTRSLPRSRPDPRIQLLNRNGVLYTKLPHATTPNVTLREHHARRRTTMLTMHRLLLYCLRAHLPSTTTRSRPSTLMTTWTRDLRFRGRR